MFFGSGAASADVQLSRGAAKTLTQQSDNAFQTGKAAHGSLPVATAYPAGAQYYCSSDKQPLWSDGTNWVEADGTNH